MPTYRGGCHCGRIVFEVVGELVDVLLCNCSICTKKGYLHWIVPSETFCLITPEADVATYQFGTRVARHHFCAVCGIAPFYIPRSDPDKVDVNVRCLEGVDPTTIPTRSFDGKNWETAYETYRQTSS